jgi:hypothetical protein
MPQSGGIAHGSAGPDRQYHPYVRPLSLCQIMVEEGGGASRFPATQGALRVYRRNNTHFLATKFPRNTNSAATSLEQR